MDRRPFGHRRASLVNAVADQRNVAGVYHQAWCRRSPGVSRDRLFPSDRESFLSWSRSEGTGGRAVGRGNSARYGIWGTDGHLER